MGSRDALCMCNTHMCTHRGASGKSWDFTLLALGRWEQRVLRAEAGPGELLSHLGTAGEDWTGNEDTDSEAVEKGR